MDQTVLLVCSRSQLDETFLQNVILSGEINQNDRAERKQVDAENERQAQEIGFKDVDIVEVRGVTGVDVEDPHVDRQSILRVFPIVYSRQEVDLFLRQGDDWLDEQRRERCEQQRDERVEENLLLTLTPLQNLRVVECQLLNLVYESYQLAQMKIVQVEFNEEQEGSNVVNWLHEELGLLFDRIDHRGCHVAQHGKDAQRMRQILVEAM